MPFSRCEAFASNVTEISNDKGVYCVVLPGLENAF